MMVVTLGPGGGIMQGPGLFGANVCGLAGPFASLKGQDLFLSKALGDLKASSK